MEWRDETISQVGRVYRLVQCQGCRVRQSGEMKQSGMQDNIDWSNANYASLNNEATMQENMGVVGILVSLARDSAQANN
eukprot:1140278-Pelagomonas_calceolata.AAC.3